MNFEPLNLYLDVKTQEDNLYTNYNGTRDCLYFIDGMMSEDEHVFTFSQEAEYKLLEGRSVLDSVNTADLDYMLNFYIVLFEKGRVYISQYESKKMRNLNRLDEHKYEVPLVNEKYMMNNDIEDLLMYYAYASEEAIDQSDLYANPKKIFKYFINEKEKIYQDGILNNSEYNDFIDEINLFINKYGIEFEQSEGTEMILSTIYVLRKYLNTGWDRVYELLKA